MRLSIVAVLPFLFLLGGCVGAIPVPQLPSEHVEFINESALQDVAKGGVAIKTVHERLGDPKYEFEDPQRWVYLAKRHRAGKLRVCGGYIIPVPSESARGEAIDGGGCTDKTNKLVITYLILTFESGQTTFATVTEGLKAGKCGKSGFCRDDKGGVFFQAR